MAKITGQDGEVDFGEETLKVTRWELNQTEPILDVTDSSNAGYRQKLAKGIIDWSATINGYYDDGDTYPSLGASASLVLQRATGDTITGTALVTSFNEVVPVEGEEAMSFTIEFIGNGALE